jgi:hypothetical protein
VKTNRKLKVECPHGGTLFLLPGLILPHLGSGPSIPIPNESGVTTRAKF